jgi:hypothetical protein
VADKDRRRWPRFKTKEAAQEIAARCDAMERQTMVHWRVMSTEDCSWIVAASKDGWTSEHRAYALGAALRPLLVEADIGMLSA